MAIFSTFGLNKLSGNNGNVFKSINCATRGARNLIIARLKFLRYLQLIQGLRFFFCLQEEKMYIVTVRMSHSYIRHWKVWEKQNSSTKLQKSKKTRFFLVFSAHKKTLRIIKFWYRKYCRIWCTKISVLHILISCD